MKIHPYLYFGGRCQEALDFYQATLGAVIDMQMPFSEGPDNEDCPTPEGWEDKVMHASLLIDGNLVMASDGYPGEIKHGGYSLSLSYDDQEGAKKTFEALSEGGEIQMPLGQTFWSPCFGMVTDKFGVSWMITIYEEKA